MTKTHIALVGGQTAPVYSGIIDRKPDMVIFICSNESREQAERIKAEISIPSEVNIIDPVNLDVIFSEVQKMAKELAENEVSINISSGTKPWSLYFYEIFSKHPNCIIFYIDQNNNVGDLKNRKSHTVDFDMDAHFRLYGNSMEGNYKKFSDYTDKDRQIVPEIEEIRSFNFADFKSLTTVLNSDFSTQLRDNNSGLFSLPSNSFLEWGKPISGKDGYVKICLFNKQGKKIERVWKSSNVIDLVFNSGWFEFKVADILSHWDKSKEIRLNCRFPFRKGFDKNEADIIINAGNKILFVECKTQITQTTDIDKFRSVVKGYGGMGSKALFVTDAKISDVAKQKCEEHNILTFSLQDKYLLSIDKTLFLLLDSEIYNINSK